MEAGVPDAERGRVEHSVVEVMEDPAVAAPENN
jgi:hypothetical protein